MEQSTIPNSENYTPLEELSVHPRTEEEEEVIIEPMNLTLTPPVE